MDMAMAITLPTPSHTKEREQGFLSSLCSHSCSQEASKSISHINLTHTWPPDIQGWEMIVDAERASVSLEHTAQLPALKDLARILEMCIEERDVSSSKRVYFYMCYNGLENHRPLINQIYLLFLDCGNLAEAQHVWLRHAQGHTCLWVSILEAHIKCGDVQGALEILSKAQFDCSQLSKDVLQALVKGCTRLKWVKQGQQIHSGLVREGLETEIILTNYLIELYAKCALFNEARDTLDELPKANVFSWNFLCLGYVECGLDREVLQCLVTMKMAGVYPNSVTYLCTLKVCAKDGDPQPGRSLHAEISKEGFESNNFVSSALLDMYAKCGCLVEAQEVFDGMPVKDVISWTALIAGYANHGQGIAALDCFHQMLSIGVLPNAVTLLCALKACTCVGAITKGQQLHAEVVKEEFERNAIIGSALVDMYMKCNSAVEAWAVFDELPVKDVVTWTALVAGLAEHELDDEIVNSIGQMQADGISMDPVIYVHLLRACGNTSAIDKGREAHSEIVDQGLECSPSIGSALVDMYAKLGLPGEAQDVFGRFISRDVVLWTTLITAYIDYGLCEEAVECLEKMQVEGVLPDDVTFICTLHACGVLGCVHMGWKVHIWIVLLGFDKDPLVGNAMVDSYMKFGLLAEALKAFDSLVVQDGVSWNILITGFGEGELHQDVLDSIEKMKLNGLCQGDVTFICCLKACASLGATQKGRDTHMEIVKMGYEGDAVIANCLVDMYANLGCFIEVCEVFNSMHVRNVVSWNILMAGHMKHQHEECVLECLDEMVIVDGVIPNMSTLVYGLKCCGSIPAISRGMELHTEVIQKGYESDVSVASAVVDMYANCGLLTDARGALGKLPVRESAWNTLISGYLEQGLNEEALACFQEMLHEGMSPDNIVFVSVMKACGSLGAINEGKEAHILSVKEGFEGDLYVGNTLVDMYVKCGCLVEACQLFESLSDRDVVSWSTVLAGYARRGESNIVFHFIKDMEEAGVCADHVTILSALTACSHAGLVDKGQALFEAIEVACNISPYMEHYNCMLDLLSRAGQIHGAVLMMKEMPFQLDAVTSSTMIGACRKCGDHYIAQQIFQLSMKSNDEQGATVNLMYNMYADYDTWGMLETDASIK